MLCKSWPKLKFSSNRAASNGVRAIEHISVFNDAMDVRYQLDSALGLRIVHILRN